MNAAAIPGELKAQRHWVEWRLEERDGRPTKVPYKPSGRGRASVTDPATWGSYEDLAPGSDAIGFVVTAEDPFVGVDIDGCIDESGNLHPDAKQIVVDLATYTELTPSRRGLRCWLKGELNGSRRRTGKTPWGDSFEVYDRDRYFTVTGDRIAGEGIEERQAELEAVLGRMFPTPSENGLPSEPDPLPTVDDVGDEELLQKAGSFRNGAEFERLWRGDHSGYPSHSEARLALLNHLAFLAGPDPARIDRLFRRSGLMCEKRERLGPQEIALALEGKSEFYTPPAQLRREVEDRDLSGPFAISLEEFIASRSELPPALIGDGDDVILPRAGLLILGGKGGRGKTTLAVDGAFHLASGRGWLGFEVSRPLNVLFIENEGPQEMFREKIEAKRECWPHQIEGEIYVHVFDWGNLDLRDELKRRALRDFISERQVDVVIGDPLDSCGLEGVGSPEDTRAFMELAKDVGLHTSVAFWFLHHPRKEKTDDELDELAGAWGGRPDTVLTLNMLEEGRSRLGIPKVRWSRRGKRPADPRLRSRERGLRGDRRRGRRARLRGGARGAAGWRRMAHPDRMRLAEARRDRRQAGERQSNS